MATRKTGRKTTIRPNNPENRFNVEDAKVTYLTREEIEEKINDSRTEIYTTLYNRTTFYLNKHYRIMDIPDNEEYVKGYCYYKLTKRGGPISIIRNPKEPDYEDEDDEDEEEKPAEPIDQLKIPKFVLPCEVKEYRQKFRKYYDDRFKEFIEVNGYYWDMFVNDFNYEVYDNLPE
jgi:hypothetical protein